MLVLLLFVAFRISESILLVADMSTGTGFALVPDCVAVVAGSDIVSFPKNSSTPWPIPVKNPMDCPAVGVLGALVLPLLV